MPRLCDFKRGCKLQFTKLASQNKILIDGYSEWFTFKINSFSSSVILLMA